MSSEQLKRYLIVPALVVFLLGVYKSWAIASEMSESWAGLFIQIIGGDILVGSVVLYISLAASISRIRSISFLLFIVAAGLSIVYAADCFLLLALDHRLDFGEVARYLPEWRLIIPFFSVAQGVFVILFCGSFFLSVSLRGRVVGILVITLLVCDVAIVLRSPSSAHLKKYHRTVLRLFLPHRARPAMSHRYSGRDVELHQREYREREKLTLPGGKPNALPVLQVL